MTTTTLLRPTAMWRSVAARPQSSVHACTHGTGHSYGNKPVTAADFGNVSPTRRGIPPQ
jgi:hypothetical protein